ncbi:hypothetical protein PF008_g19723 [Phytophthora fragariae]|uniref:Uncharacterized protein n=1 Tax=Phytophthora fragariae TaxID=53985 RepID=A0A6G0R1U4_9STRA|nr:hypothetical protein PF008_g19723 [Phytophthora fragariae]
MLAPRWLGCAFLPSLCGNNILTCVSGEGGGHHLSSSSDSARSVFITGAEDGADR